MEKTLNTKALVERPKRVTVANRSRIQVRDQDPNYVYRIVNCNLDSDPDRVANLKDVGYELVPDNANGQLGDKRIDNPSTLGSVKEISVGQGTKAVLMRIPKEYYQEDQLAKQRTLKEQEDSAHKRADYGKIEITHTKG